MVVLGKLLVFECLSISLPNLVHVLTSSWCTNMTYFWVGLWDLETEIFSAKVFYLFFFIELLCTLYVYFLTYLCSVSHF